ncbi:MAG: RNA methyltransferase [Bdellovibrionaceae bacterium]|nr:RNA methyltransferase [Pseudobdellovibrionaceae bacterium]
MFPFPSRLTLNPQLSVNHHDVIEHIGPLLTAERRQKIERVVAGRTFTPVVVLEDVYDRGNASAVFRSAEAMGFGQVHMIELGEKIKESQRTTAGADKWVELKRWKSTKACVDELKKQGKKIVVTHLAPSSVPIDEFDFTQPSALVLGNEKNGVSPEMVAAADACVVLPMRGFVQSFNISVAGALALWHIMKDRERRQGHHGDMTEEQKQILTALYYLRTQDSAEDTLRELKARGVIKD